MSRVRPVTTGSSNRKQASTDSLTVRSRSSLNVTRSTGSWSLSKIDDRPRIESAATSRTRMRETVGLTRSPVFESKDWESESKDKYRIRPLTFADRLLERNEEKEKAYQQAFDKWVADKARRKLQYFVNHRFGGAVDNLFQFADTDGDGLISFEEFSTIIKKSQLEQFFSRKEQRDAFRAIDEDRSGTVDISELVVFLTDEPDGGYAPDGSALPRVVKAHDSAPKKRRGRANEERDAEPTELQGVPKEDSDDEDSSNQAPTPKLTISKDQRSEEQDHRARMERTKDRIVAKIVKRRRQDKNEDGHGFDAQFVMTAFRQADEDQSGTLSREELKHTFGPNWLNLMISDSDLDDFIAAADCDNDGKVSYTEFIKALAIHDLEPSFNPIMEARERGLNMMKERLKKPFKFQKEYEEMYATAMEKKAESEALDRTVAATRGTLAQSHKSGPEDNPRAGLVNAPWLISKKPVPRLPAPGSDKADPEHDGRPVESSGELFADMARIRRGIMARAQGGKSGREHHNFDNGRVGVGTGGVDPNSGLYVNSAGRFTTTYSQYFAPIVYEPNKPLTRPKGVCSSKIEAEGRARRRNARLARSQATKDIIKERTAQEELMILMDQDQRERGAAELAYDYNCKTYFADLRMQAKEPIEVMSKRPHWPRHAKSYGTSQKTQLREMVKNPDVRDMESIFSKDFSYVAQNPKPPANMQNRIAARENLASSFTLTHDDGFHRPCDVPNLKARMTQVSSELQGGNIPDLHRTTMKNRW